MAHAQKGGRGFYLVMVAAAIYKLKLFEGAVKSRKQRFSQPCIQKEKFIRLLSLRGISIRQWFSDVIRVGYACYIVFGGDGC